MDVQLERDSVFSLAERYVNETGVSVFLTGKAGTGKTTFLKHITSTTSKRFVVLAPTGVAAINAGGSTIHSFFQLPLCPYLPDVKELVTEYQMPGQHSFKKDRMKIIRSLELLIIDEISMVRADILDAIDWKLRKCRKDDRPFGGVQLLMIGDAHQLSPVVRDNERQYMEMVYPSPYFFCSKALQNVRYVTIELQKVHRQKDAAFLDILNAVRENRLTQSQFDLLNSRVGAEMNAGADGTEPIRLVTHNRQADEINSAKLKALPGRTSDFSALVEGDFPENSFPVDEVISLKPGAQVMFTRNDSNGEYYNGKLGTVVSVEADDLILVSDSGGGTIAVQPVKWENIQYSLDDDSGEIRQEVLGSFTQIPLRPAWAITIHKSQGLTFDNVIIDASAAFAFGQVYVALSRCRSLEGIVLQAPVYPSSIYSDRFVRDFNRSAGSLEDVALQLDARVSEYRYDCLAHLFTLEPACRSLGVLSKIWALHLAKMYPAQDALISSSLLKMNALRDVAARFRTQMAQIRHGVVPGGEEFLTERLGKAAEYFLSQMKPLREECDGLPYVETDNREVKKKLKETCEELFTQLDMLVKSMEMICSDGFSVEAYSRIRTECMVHDHVSARRKPLKKLEHKPGESDSVNEALRERLQKWRMDRFKADNVPAYTIMHQSTLLDIARFVPVTPSELVAIKGFGESKLAKYGEDILSICKEFKNE